MSVRFRVLTATEQLARHLRDELLRGTWTGVMPGEDRLMARLGVGRNTIKAALRKLEEEGLLISRGVGVPRGIAVLKNGRKTRALRVRMLLYDGADRGAPDNVELLARLQGAGHAASFSNKSLKDLGMRVERVARFVESEPADAWVVSAGSREVLEWFSRQPVPAIAMFGRFSGLPIAAACPRKSPAMVAGVRKLVELGHRRIVMLTHEEKRKPSPGLFEQNFLDELDALGLPTGPYNLPDWEDGPEGFHACLESLFERTPPTALIFCDSEIFLLPTFQYLMRRGLRIPEDVSLLADDYISGYSWTRPVISHIRWDYRTVVRRVLQWVENVSAGREDRRQVLGNARLVEGGTMARAPGQAF